MRSAGCDLLGVVLLDDRVVGDEGGQRGCLLLFGLVRLVVLTFPRLELGALERSEGIERDEGLERGECERGGSEGGQH